jgi:hypothetical protein
MKIDDIVEISKYDDEINNIDEISFEQFQLSPTKFLIDFGPWKKGQEVNCISFCFDEGTIKEFNEEGYIVKQAELILSAKE